MTRLIFVKFFYYHGTEKGIEWQIEFFRVEKVENGGEKNRLEEQKKYEVDGTSVVDNYLDLIFQGKLSYFTLRCYWLIRR